MRRSTNWKLEGVSSQRLTGEGTRESKEESYKISFKAIVNRVLVFILPILALVMHVIN